MTDFVTRPLKPSDWTQAVTLFELCFASDVAFNALPYYPNFRWEHLRGGFLRGKLVSFLRVQPFHLRFGRTVWVVAGIGGVCTHPDVRQRGYASVLMRDALTYIAEMGAHLALLNGTDYFYQPFGFSSVLPHYNVSIALDKLVVPPSRATTRLANENDLSAMANLYQRVWGGRVTFERSPELWRWLWQVDHDNIRVAVSDKGQIEGYLRHENGGALDVGKVEVVIRSRDALFALLAEEATRLQAQHQLTLNWFVPPDDLIIPYLRLSVPITMSVDYDQHGGWMARLIDASGFVNGLLQEVNAHLRTNYAHISEKPHIRVLSDVVEITFRRTLCRLSHRDFIQVVFGSLSPEMLAVQHSLNDDTVEMLSTLFPSRIACIAAWDWF